MFESPVKYMGELFREVVDRVCIGRKGDVVSIGCEDTEHADRVFELLERIGDAAEAFGAFEPTNGNEPRKGGNVASEVIEQLNMVRTGVLPDGDHVPVCVTLWADQLLDVILHRRK